MTRQGSTAAQEMVQQSLAFIPARAIYVAAKLGIADLVKSKPLTAVALANELEVDSDALSRILRVLVTMGIFSRSDDGRIAPTSRGLTLCSDTPDSLRDFIILNHEIPHRAFENVMYTVQTGKPADVATFGAPIFQYLKSDKEAANVFHAGLRNRGRIEIASLLDAYDFSGAGKIIDVGGGTGALLSAILTRYDELEAVLLDSEPVIEAARKGLGGPLPRCELVAGDFFESVPQGGDTYILKLILHDWRDDDAIRIMKRCREAMKEDGRLLIIEGLIKATDTLSMTDIMDLTMLVAIGGMERSEQEYTALLKRSGFALERVVPTSLAPSIIEARPS